MNSRTGVIFDLDGVLVDTGWAHKQSWYDLAEKEGFSMSDEFFSSTFGMRNDQIIPMLTGGEVSSEDVARLGEWKEQRYRELIAAKLTLPHGVGELLDDLKQNGFLLARSTAELLRGR
ncbi:MAG: HAD hydrolase-like protein [Sedimentisphaerales bacterium]